MDGVELKEAAANYGTNGGTAPTRPDSPPTSSDDLLVSQMVYNDRGEVEESIDPAGKRNFSRYDDAGRPIESIANYGGQVTQTVRTTYAPDGGTATLTALNPDTGDQVTTYTYGTTLDDSDLATSSLLRSVTYPDGGVVTYAYNRQSEQIVMIDQNGSVHEYARDQLGRLTSDAATTLASNVDGTVRRIGQSYDNRMRLESVTSYNAASGGDVVNQVQMAYNDFSQVATEYQEHTGAVSMSTSPRVGYSYADGSSNTTRRTGISYPNGAALAYGYSSTINDKLSRVSGIDFKGATVAEYTYLGAGSVVQVGYADTTPEVQYTLAFGAGSDPYQGLDRFDRVIDLRWERLGSSASSSSSSAGESAELVHLKYGYDRASNRLWREDLVAESYGKNFDELYIYDGLDRLIDFNRGELNTAHTTITGQTLGQKWALDETGNWNQFSENSCDNGTSCDALVQNRTHNEANEIVAITPVVGPTWAQVNHDANGNMTTLPQPNEPTKGYLATWDAWNRLVVLRDETTGLVVSEYEYDGTNRRTLLTDFESGTPNASTDFYYSDAWQVLEEHRDTSTSMSSSSSNSGATAPYKQYVWGIRYVDDCVLQDRDSTGGGAMEERSFALQGATWNVLAITDDQADIVERYAYDAYGKVAYLSLTGSLVDTQTSAVDQPYQFTGRRRDDMTGVYSFRARYYDATLGRFANRDLLGYVDGLNLYQAYFVPDALDPSGLILAGIDGTNSKAFHKEPIFNDQRYVTGTRSHVFNFIRDATESPKKFFFGPEESGLATPLIAKNVYDWICLQICAKMSKRLWRQGYQPPVDIIGHSRGGHIAMEVARKLRDDGCDCCTDRRRGPFGIMFSYYHNYKPIHVRFLGLYDAVDMSASFGAEPRTIPSNVGTSFHAFAAAPPGAKKSRSWFNRADDGPEINSWRHGYAPVYGTHSAIGGAPWNGDHPQGYSYAKDIQAAIQADMGVRNAARFAGVGINIKTAAQYGYAQPEIPTRPWDRANSPYPLMVP